MSLIGRTERRGRDEACCRCGHPRAVHLHYRRGLDCAVCGPSACPRYRRVRWRWRPARSGAATPDGQRTASTASSTEAATTSALRLLLRIGPPPRGMVGIQPPPYRPDLAEHASTDGCPAGATGEGPPLPAREIATVRTPSPAFPAGSPSYQHRHSPCGPDVRRHVFAKKERQGQGSRYRGGSVLGGAVALRCRATLALAATTAGADRGAALALPAASGRNGLLRRVGLLGLLELLVPG